MTITLQQEPIFTIESNGQKLTGFTVESEWEGFKKMRRGPEYVILATTKAVPPFSAVFSGLLAAFMEGKPQSDEYCALVASPMLHAAFTGEPPVNPLQATVDQLRAELASANQLAQLNGEIAADLKGELLARPLKPKADELQDLHLFELWWAEYLPDTPHAAAFEAWSAAHRSKGVGVEQPDTPSASPGAPL